MVFCPNKKLLSFDGTDSCTSIRKTCLAYTKFLSVFKLSLCDNPPPTSFQYESSKVPVICNLIDYMSIIKDRTDNGFLDRFIDTANSLQHSTGERVPLFNLNEIRNDIEDFLYLQGLAEDNILHVDEICGLTSDKCTLSNTFEKHSREYDGIRFDYYMIDPNKLISNQFSTVKKTDLIIDHDKNYGEWSPVTSGFGKSIIPRVKNMIKSSRKEGVRWYDSHSSKNVIQSMVGMCQLYSDKSATTLNIGGVSFHPIHVTLLNFKRKVRQKLIACGLTILGFLPTSFFTNMKSFDDTDRWIKDSSVLNNQRMKLLNRVISEHLGGLFNNLLKGIKIRTHDGYDFNVHMVPSNYCADIPEAKDLLRVKHGQLTLQPCFRCHIFNSQLAAVASAALRTVQSTQKALTFYESALKLSSEKRYSDPPLAKKFKYMGNFAIGGISQHPDSPIFSEFDFVSKSYIINPYQVFTVEPLHVFHLGISKLLKECMCEKLKCKLRKTKILGKDRSVYVNLSSFRTTILRQLNAMIDSVSFNSDGLRVCPTIQKDVGKNGLCGFFGADGLIGMVEATHMKRIDNISPFFGALVDRCSDDVGTFPVTSVFSQYVELMTKVMYTEYSPDICLESLSSEIAEDIKTFKQRAFQVFSNYQTSGLRTVKWHILEHIPLDILQLGSLTNCDANSYEQSHKIFKFIYNSSTNKRSSTCFEDTITKLSECSSTQLSEMQKYYDLHENASRNTTFMEVKDTGINKPVRHWFLTSLDTFYNTLNSTFKNIEHAGSTTLPYLHTEFKEYLKHIGETAATTLFECINEVAREKEVNTNVDGRITIKFSKTAYIINRRCPTLKDVNESGVAVITDSEFWSVGKITASNIYYGSEMGRYDTVFLRSRSNSSHTSDKEEIWFGKVLSIVTIETAGKFKHVSRLNCALHNMSNCSICSGQQIGTYAFVQYYDIVKPTEVPIDNIEKTLNCIRLKWARTHKDIQEDMDSGKQYGLCHIESLMGVVHVLPAMEILRPLNENSDYKASTIRNIGPLDRWEGHLFYVNRYYRDHSSE